MIHTLYHWSAVFLMVACYVYWIALTFRYKWALHRSNQTIHNQNIWIEAQNGIIRNLTKQRKAAVRGMVAFFPEGWDA